MCKRKRPKFKVGDILERWYHDSTPCNYYVVTAVEFYPKDQREPWDYKLASIQNINKIYHMSARYVDKFLSFRKVA